MVKGPQAPLAPKFYGGIAGSGTGAALSAALVAVIQAYWIHGTLDPAAVQVIYLVIPLLGTAYGIWKAPHQARPGDAAALGELADAAVTKVLAARLRVGAPDAGLDILGPAHERTPRVRGHTGGGGGYSSGSATGGPGTAGTGSASGVGGASG